VDLVVEDNEPANPMQVGLFSLETVSAEAARLSNAIHEGARHVKSISGLSHPHNTASDVRLRNIYRTKSAVDALGQYSRTLAGFPYSDTSHTIQAGSAGE
jgi:hypothetical protein